MKYFLPLLAVLAIAMFVAVPAANATVLDDFSTDDESNYTWDWTYPAAQPADGWSVSGGVMSPTNLGSTQEWFWNDNTMAPGDSVSVDVLIGGATAYRQGGLRLSKNLGGDKGSLTYAGDEFNIAYLSGWVVNVNGDYAGGTLTGSPTGFSTLTLTRGTGANQADIAWDVSGGGLSGSGTHTIAGLVVTENLYFALDVYNPSGGAGDVSFDNLTIIPEPTSLALLGLGGLGLLVTLRRRRR